MTSDLHVLHAGWNTTVQDAGRPGRAHLGVPSSGAVDPGLAALVNRLVGNPDAAPVIETTGDLVVRAGAATIVASTWSLGPVALHHHEEFTVPLGGRVWHYLAVRGGLVVDRVLGSCSTDTLSGLGPPPLRDGDRLTIGGDPGTPLDTDVAPLGELPSTARVLPGPRADRFAPDWRAVMAAGEWRITDNSRVGVRLAGPTLERRVTAELPSGGLVRGAMQVPPSGELVVMSADHPTTGGYPVIGVIDPDDLPAVTQRPPGATVRLRPSR